MVQAPEAPQLVALAAWHRRCFLYAPFTEVQIWQASGQETTMSQPLQQFSACFNTKAHMHFLVLNPQERKEGRVEEGACLCGKEWKGQEMEKSSHCHSQTPRRPSALSLLLHPWPWLLFWIQGQWDFQSEKNKASPAGQRKEGNHSEPLGEGQGEQNVTAPTCLPPFLSLQVAATEQTEDGTLGQLGSSRCPGSSPQDRPGNLMQGSGHCCCFPFLVLLHPLQQSHAHCWCKEAEISACLVKTGFAAPQGQHHCSYPAVSLW